MQVGIQISPYQATATDWGSAWNTIASPDNPNRPKRVGAMNTPSYPVYFWYCFLVCQPVSRILPFDLIINLFSNPPSTHPTDFSIFRVPREEPLSMAAIAQLTPIFSSNQIDNEMAIKDMGDTGEPLIFLAADRNPNPRPTGLRTITGAWLNMADPIPFQIRDSGLAPMTTSGLRPESSGLALTAAGEQLINFKSGFLSC
jgi:hypothetical protein